jgi:redox-sensitive bicupin YhaK (pirin superfamily)
MDAKRRIEERARGLAHGPITRLISPAGLGERLKPFIFLDFFSAYIEPGFGFPMHPHSGIATLTWQPGCDVKYEDTTGQRGVLKAGGLEWMNAGGGAWHQGTLLGQGRATGFQLWVPMPPGVEDGPSAGQYVAPEDVVTARVPGGEIKILLGSLPSNTNAPLMCSPIESHQDMNYLVLTLEPGAHWAYAVPPDHEIAWAFVFEGQARVQREWSSRELLTFEQRAGDIGFSSGDEEVRVLLGSARRHAHPLVLGPSSVHTSRSSLLRGMHQIEAVGRELVRSGRLVDS